MIDVLKKFGAFIVIMVALPVLLVGCALLFTLTFLVTALATLALSLYSIPVSIYQTLFPQNGKGGHDRGN